MSRRIGEIESNITDIFNGALKGLRKSGMLRPDAIESRVKYLVEMHPSLCHGNRH
ncbi:MAG: hypothetical protein ACP5SG_04940 [Dissulfurimicrobium sp.]|uniref:hypothetical protein n=1 Tax=Dissulfurimicrobium sp. TaxID=2022436 RepID=UPI003D0BE441